MKAAMSRTLLACAALALLGLVSTIPSAYARELNDDEKTEVSTSHRNLQGVASDSGSDKSSGSSNQFGTSDGRSYKERDEVKPNGNSYESNGFDKYKGEDKKDDNKWDDGRDKKDDNKWDDDKDKKDDNKWDDVKDKKDDNKWDDRDDKDKKNDKKWDGKDKNGKDKYRDVDKYNKDKRGWGGGYRDYDDRRVDNKKRSYGGKFKNKNYFDFYKNKNKRFKKDKKYNKNKRFKKDKKYNKNKRFKKDKKDNRYGNKRYDND